MKQNLELDQHFLIDKEIINTIIKSANIEKTDNVIEIGAGTGNITKELAKQANKVLALEIDQQFEPYLSKLPNNITVKYTDAFHFFRGKQAIKKHTRFEKDILSKLEFDKVGYSKIVAAMPYALCEPIAHSLLYVYDYDLAVWIVPSGFVKYLLEHPIPRSMVEVKVIQDIPKSAFQPQPNTTSKLIVIRPKKIKLPSEADQYLARSLYLLEPMKLKNALREALIKLNSKLGKMLTKKQAKSIVSKFDLSKEILDTKVHDLGPEIYLSLQEKLKKSDF